ncbi:hypothetical protein MLD38_005689 [Melastoma candidum]|uniref:Uncharacterized protein n=1 Tax=Melastoma candidum TaxID=119954 RepID=A0ACB9RK80_9MYRT|nr:hypothetical protein MLD38_005689 [Melastoma candidum]
MSKSVKMGSSSSVSSSDLIDTKLEEHHVCGSKLCPSCGHRLEGKPDWLGLPAGVKFDPTDQELIEHLEAKVESNDDLRSHPLIDEFVPTIEGEDGICYTHPERLPGVTRDGLSKHFFHRPSKAYTTGTRKRRKIQTDCDLQGGETRWHKTGKTRPVMVNGRQKGCKKILVLYTNFGKNRKPEKTNWVMHQYHLGMLEEEKEGELVVSKIFYQTQPRQCNLAERGATATTPSTASSSGGCSVVREVVHPQSEDISNVPVVGPAQAMSGYCASASEIQIQQLKAEHFGFAPFRKSFEEVGGIEEASTAREGGQAAATSAACEEYNHRMNPMSTLEDQMQLHHHHQHQHLQHQQHHDHHLHPISTVAFHVVRPSLPISATMIPPPTLHHQASINILEDDTFHVSRMILQNEFQTQQHHHQQQQRRHQQQPQQLEHEQHKLVIVGGGGRSATAATGLEEIIMGCTATTTTSSDIKEESSIPNPQEPEWFKYSSFWPDPDNPDHHG